MWRGDSSPGHSGRQGDHGERLSENSAPLPEQHVRRNFSNQQTLLSQWNDVYHDRNISLTTQPTEASLPAVGFVDDIDATALGNNLVAPPPQQDGQGMQMSSVRLLECPEVTEMSSLLSALEQHDPRHGVRRAAQPPAAATTCSPTSGRISLQSAQDTRDYHPPFLEFFDTTQPIYVACKENSNKAQSTAPDLSLDTCPGLHSEVQAPRRAAPQNVQDTKYYEPLLFDLFDMNQPISVACKANSDQAPSTAPNLLSDTYQDSHESQMISNLRLKTNPQHIPVRLTPATESNAFGYQRSNQTSQILTDAGRNTEQVATPTFDPSMVGSCMQSVGIPLPVGYGNCSSVNQLGFLPILQQDALAAPMQMTEGICYSQPPTQQQLLISQFLQHQIIQQEKLFEQNQILFSKICQKSGSGISAGGPSSNSQVILPSKKQKGSQNPVFPKRPLTAYNLFFKDERAKMLGIVSNELSYQQHGDTDHLQHPLLPEKHYRLGPTAHLAVSLKDSNQATGQDERKCSSANKRPKIRIGFAEMARRVSVEWKQADAETKAMYQARATQDKARYNREKNEYLQRTKRGQGEAREERRFK